jgi:hypothetical protein
MKTEVSTSCTTRGFVIRDVNKSTPRRLLMSFNVFCMPPPSDPFLDALISAFSAKALVSLSFMMISFWTILVVTEKVSVSVMWPG